MKWGVARCFAHFHRREVYEHSFRNECAVSSVMSRCLTIERMHSAPRVITGRGRKLFAERGLKISSQRKRASLGLRGPPSRLRRFGEVSP